MTNTSEDDARKQFDLPADEFAAVFEKIPGPCLVVDPSFMIVAVNDACCSASIRDRADMIGRHLFEVFPDNPHQSGSDAVENFRTSLLKVLKTRQPDRMRIQKYDVRRRGTGAYEERYWSSVNTPVLGADGFVKWIIYRGEDVTEVVKQGVEPKSQGGAGIVQRLIDQLHETEDQLASARGEIARLRELLDLPEQG